MKKILFLLLITVASYGQTLQNPTFGNVKLKQNTTSTTAAKVNVQETDGTVNTIAKSDLVDAIIVDNATQLTTAIGDVNKLYATRDNNILYRFNGTIYVPLSADVSGKEDIANKSSSFTSSSIVTYANTKALVDGLATKSTYLDGTAGAIPRANGGGNSLSNSRIIDNNSTNNGITFSFNNVVTERIYLNKGANANGVEIRASANGLFDQGASDNNTIVSLTGGLAEGSENYGGFKVLVQDNAGASKLGFFTGGASGSPTLRATIRNNGNFLVGTATDNNQGIGQFNGNITASPATLSNQVVVKSQLDEKQNTISGTANVIPKFGSGGLVGSNIFDDGANVSIGNIGVSKEFSISMFNSFVRFRERDLNNIFAITTNLRLDGSNDDISMSSWRLAFGSGSDNFKIGRANPNSPSITEFIIINNSGATTFSSSVTATNFIGSATLTGTPTAPTATAGSVGTQIANKDYVTSGLATKQNTISGTANVIPKFGSGGLVGSNISDDGGVVSTSTDILANGIRLGKGNGGLTGNIAIGGTNFANDIYGTGNVALSNFALSANKGFGNLAIGAESLLYNVDGGGIIGIGFQAGSFTSTSSNNTRSDDSVFIGASTKPNAINQTNQIVIGTSAIGAGSNTATLGNTSITQTILRGAVTAGTSIVSPNLTGIPTAPTATVGTNTTQLATTAYVLANAGSVGSLEFNATNLTVWNNGKGNGSTNTSFGDSALANNTVISNSFNSAFGNGALSSNTSGTNNTAVGHNALSLNVGGTSNVAIGSFALSTANTSSNVAVGNSSLNKTTGGSNTAVGTTSLFENTTGSSNTAIGDSAARFIADGITANAIANNSIFLGSYTKALASNQTNQIVIGDNAIGAGSNTATLGNASVVRTVLSGVIQKRTLDTAPASATDTGTLGEVRVTATHIYVCTATNTWVRTALTTW